DHTAQKGRRAVTLLVQLAVEPVQGGEHLIEADRVAPLERPARMVEAGAEGGVDVGGGADALRDREASLVDELAGDPPEHQPGSVADPLDVLAERSEERLGGLGTL